MCNAAMGAGDGRIEIGDLRLDAAPSDRGCEVSLITEGSAMPNCLAFPLPFPLDVWGGGGAWSKSSSDSMSDRGAFLGLWEMTTAACSASTSRALFIRFSPFGVGDAIPPEILRLLSGLPSTESRPTELRMRDALMRSSSPDKEVLGTVVGRWGVVGAFGWVGRGRSGEPCCTGGARGVTVGRVGDMVGPYGYVEAPGVWGNIAK